MPEFICKECGKKYKREFYYKKHLKEKHEIDIDEEEGNEEGNEESNEESNEEGNDKIIKNRIYNCNCESYLDKLYLQKIKIDLVILDPPYFNVVNEKWDKQWNSLDDYLKWLENIIFKIEKVVKNNCTFWIFGFIYQLSFIIPIMEKHGFTYRQHIALNKGLRSVAGRTSNKLKMFPVASEYIIYFYKDSRNFIKKYLQNKQKEHNIKSSDINLKLGKAINGGGTWSTIAGKKQKNIQYPTREDWDKLQEIFGEFDIKYDDNVYTFNIETKLTDIWNDINFYDKTYKKLHPTQKPYKLIERLINCSTNENYNVLDPFMGSGMTGLVCQNKNRNYYGCELDKKYFKNNLLSK